MYAKYFNGHVTYETPLQGKIFYRVRSGFQRRSCVENLESLAQAVLKICLIVCQKLQASLDLCHARCDESY